jgi:hypothetical protein
MYRQSIDVWVVSACPQVFRQIICHSQGYRDLKRVRDQLKRWGHGLTETQRKNNASMENANGKASHEKRRKTRKYMSPTGIATSSSTLNTTRGVGRWREWPLRATIPAGSGSILSEIADAAACKAVDRREAKIEPVPPGMPKSRAGVSAGVRWTFEGATYHQRRQQEVRNRHSDSRTSRARFQTRLKSPSRRVMVSSLLSGVA